MENKRTIYIGGIAPMSVKEWENFPLNIVNPLVASLQGTDMEHILLYIEYPRRGEFRVVDVTQTRGLSIRKYHHGLFPTKVWSIDISEDSYISLLATISDHARVKSLPSKYLVLQAILKFIGLQKNSYLHHKNMFPILNINNKYWDCGSAVLNLMNIVGIFKCYDNYPGIPSAITAFDYIEEVLNKHCKKISLGEFTQATGLDDGQ